MADTNANVQIFEIRDLSTQTVTFFPDRAQIVRQIKDITLEVGLTLRALAMKLLLQK